MADYNIQHESIINMAVIDSFDDLAFSTGLPVSSGFNPFMMRSATSGAGAGWSIFNYTNAVDLSASSVGAYTLSLYTITPGIGGSVPGLLPGFDALQSYDWTFVTSAAGITGFSPDQFVIDADDFADPYPGVFAVAQQGDSLAITYNPVPESSTLVLVAVAAAGCGAHLLRRRRRAGDGRMFFCTDHRRARTLGEPETALPLEIDTASSCAPQGWSRQRTST